MKISPKRLIEVDLPIKRISENARDEKDSRLGHIPRLHIYPAARPLAACRAVACAALWPDPADKSCPPAFRDEAAKYISEFSRKMTSNSKLATEHCSPENFKRWQTIAASNLVLLEPIDLRAALLDFIADFTRFENSTVPEYLGTARALTQSAHKSFGGTDDSKPFVFDPFAGGGAIPVEALRIGADAFASDLNPLSILINRVILEHIPEFGETLADEVRKASTWISPRVEKELARFFPADANGAVPIAYLWARTILSEAPSTTNCPVEVPLLRSMWLTRGKGEQNWALRWATDKEGKLKSEIAQVTFANGKKVKVIRPQLEVFVPKSKDQVPTGTVRGGSVTCPITGYTTPVKRVRAQLSERAGGSRDARMYCVVTTSPNSTGRTFRTATPKDIEIVDCAAEALLEQYEDSEIPTEPLPADGTNGFRVQKYGMRTWGDLFTKRQILALLTYAKLVRNYIEQCASDQNLKTAVESVLSLLVNRLADLNSSLCGWQLNTANSAHVFVRWALPMVFDFAEVNPLAAAGGSPESALRRIHACIKDLTAATLSKGTVVQHSATSLPLADDMAAAFITDPPYYDAIPYSDLLDFFVVWMNRVCRTQTFSTVNGLSPKDEECVVDNSKAKDHEFFQRTMTQTLTEARRILAPSGIGVVVFAHKSTAGWEAQLEGLVNAGFSVTASWPIDTEMGSRMRAQGSAALASSVHLVCRPRENADGTVRDNDIGDWRDVLQELPIRIHEWMPRLAKEGVVGADAIFACLGPALEIFSRYSRVEKASGETVTLREYLEQVWAAVAKEALTMVFSGADTSGFEPDARLTAMWLWTLNAGSTNGATEESEAEEEEDSDDDTKDKKKKVGGFVLEYDAARKIAQGLGAHLEELQTLVEVAGDKARLLPLNERAKYLFGQKDLAPSSAPKKKRAAQLDFQAVMGVNFGEAEGASVTTLDVPAFTAGETILDRVHQSMLLFGTGRGEALKRFLIEDGVGKDQRFWRLAQALSALYPAQAEEKRWVDGVLARKKGLGF